MADGRLCDEAADAADLEQRQHGDRETHRHKDEHLDEITREDGPTPADQRDHEDDETSRYDGEPKIEAEHCGEKDAESVEPDAGLQQAEG